MKKIIMTTLVLLFLGLTSCAIKTPVTNQYRLQSFSAKRSTGEHSGVSILVSQPEAMSGFQTQQMLYIKRPYELTAFVHNSWAGTPANMIFPLIMQSLQYSGYFHAVSSTPYSDKADYRLDTQIIELEQNFLVKPSKEKLLVKVVLTHIDDNRVIASFIFNEEASAPTDSPYGGVIAANQAAKAFTEKLTHFIIRSIAVDKKKN